jgi:CubicO group peptidase (beta-lactamase class C family)
MPFLKDRPYLGLVVGITRPDGHQVFGYGQVTVDGKKQVPAGDTIFEVGSITKAFTGLLLADQVLAGVVRLDDPVQQYLPKELIVPKRDNRDITLLHLATHTSGLPVQPPFIVLFALTTKDPGNPYAEYDEAQLGRALANIKLAEPIGNRFQYSNLGAGILGRALAQAGKAKDFEALLVQRIAAPLKLADTRIRLSPVQEKRLACGYSRLGIQASPWTFASLESAGGLRSTTNDLLVFADAALGRPKTFEKAFAMAHEPWREIGPKGESIGLGWFRGKLPSGRAMLWHNGGTGGYRSFLAVVPKTGTGVVILSNSAHVVDGLGVAILECMEKDGANSPRP